MCIMKRITDISQLKAGDKIFRVYGGELIIKEFICIHPHNEHYSIFLNDFQDGAPKFYNPHLESEEWYLYTGNEWNEIYDMQIAWHQRQIERLRDRKKSKNNQQ